MDFVLPVPENFVVAAEAVLKSRNEDVVHYLKAQGIQFPEGSRVDLLGSQKVLIVRLPHREALNLSQIINAFMGKFGDEYAKEWKMGNENKCFNPAAK